MAGIEADKLDAFYQLARIAVLISDPAGLERHFCELVKRLVSCNAVLVFHYVTEKRELIAANPYNPAQEGDQSIVLSEEEPFVAELLLRRKSAQRLHSAEPILPAMGSELFMPLVSPFEVLGILYVARLSSFGFSKDEVLFLEHAAVNLTFALERESLRRQIARRQTEIVIRQQSYLALLEAIPYPALVVDSATDVCNEANEAARKLFGAEPFDFIDKPFRSLCQLESEGDHVFAHVGGRRYDVVSMPLLELQQSLYLFTPSGSSDAESLKTAALLSNPLPVDWSECVKSVASAIQMPTAVCIKADNGRWQTIGAFHPGTAADFQAEGFEELLERATQSRRLLRISREENRRGVRFGTDEPAAILPLWALPYAACLVVFAEGSIDWLRSEPALYLGATVLSVKLLQKAVEQAQAAARRASLAEALQRCKKERGGDQLFLNVLKATADHVACDFVAFSLSEEEEFSTAFCTAKLKPFLPKELELMPTADEDGIWHLLVASKTVSESSSIFGGLPFTLPAHYSTFILNGQNCLGRIALGRVKNVPFTPDEQQLVLDVASALAEILTEEGETVKGEARFAELLQVLAAFKGDYWTEAWRNAAAAAVGDPTLRFGFHNEADPADCIRMVLPEVFADKISPEKAADFMPSFAQDRSPLLVHTAADAAEWFCRPETSLPDSWRPIILMPVLHADRLAAVFSVSAGRPEQEEEQFELLQKSAEALSLLFSFEDLLRREFETGLHFSSVQQILQKLGGRLSIVPAIEGHADAHQID